jgi:NAD(P)-dependent dehydrogenase (short-subunit alcohol dehydrogenase family)
MNTNAQKDIRGTRWLITGGGRGLGRAVALLAASRGAKVVIVARTRAETEEVVARVVAEGGTAHALVADIAEKDQTYAISGQAAALIGPIDVLVHGAATLGPRPLATVLETPCEDLERALLVNVVGPHRLTRAVVPSMLLRKSGVVLHVSSDAASEAYPTWGAYGASKAAFELLARTLAGEVEGTGVRSVIVDPGEMDTTMHADALPDADRALLAQPAVVAKKVVRVVLDAALGGNGARVVLATMGES